MTAVELEDGYWRAYRDFYSWGAILEAAWTKDDWVERARHLAYAGGWKKLEPMWHVIVRAKTVSRLRPMLEAVLAGFGSHRSGKQNGQTKLELALLPGSARGNSVLSTLPVTENRDGEPKAGHPMANW